METEIDLKVFGSISMNMQKMFAGRNHKFSLDQNTVMYIEHDDIEGRPITKIKLVKNET